MSRAGAVASKQKKELAKLERWFAKQMNASRVDAIEVACEECGQEQVTSSTRFGVKLDGTPFVVQPSAGCVVCGHHTGRFVRPIG